LGGAVIAAMFSDCFSFVRNSNKKTKSNKNPQKTNKKSENIVAIDGTPLPKYYSNKRNSMQRS
jgi:hypothetical protein